MRGGRIRGFVSGLIVGSAAATVFGMMNWQTERRWNHQAMRTGRWVAEKTDQLFGGK